MNNGKIQIYTGNGKGKTTAAIGQAIRAAGHGYKTLIIHFMKNFPYGEIETLNLLKDFIKVEQFGDDKFVFKKQLPSDEDKAQAFAAINRANEAMQSGDFDLIILDEICVTFYFKLLEVKDVIPLLNSKPENVELILTGRYCPQELIDKADLVTEMKEIKHYYTNQNLTARKGIEN